MSRSNYDFWGFIRVSTGRIIESNDSMITHHNAFARRLGYISKEEMLKTNKFIAFELPRQSSYVRADFILGDTRDSKQRRAVVKFLQKYRKEYNIEFLDVTGYHGLTLKASSIEDVSKRLKYDPII